MSSRLVRLYPGGHLASGGSASPAERFRVSQMKAKKCTFMQTEVGFLGHIVGRAGLACDPSKLSAVRDWHEPTKLKGGCVSS